MSANAHQPELNPYQPTPYVTLDHPEWSKNAAIYEINTRQFTREGTFNAAENHLTRLKDLGITILWLMPIHEIGVKNRKGRLGSPYSVKDYYSVNHEFGGLEDLKSFVTHAHELGMYVILDWPANHTAWDNILVEEHPEWYARDWKGDVRPVPWWDWSDIIELDYSCPELRHYMTRAMKYWVKEADIDGFRADVAGFVPVDFWNNLRRELNEIKPVFMLAEWESRDLHAEAFDMTYAWSWNEAVHRITTGEADLNSLYKYYSWNERAFPKKSMRMTFVSNHDKNAWDGTMFEQFGDGLEAAIVLSVVGEGMPLIYNGQEAGNERRLKFFEKDHIEWKEHPIGDLYKQLLSLMKENSVLWHSEWGAVMVHVPNSAEPEVLSFVRQNEQNKIFAVINFSGAAHTLDFEESIHHGVYQDYLNDRTTEFDSMSALALEPWGYRVFVR